MISKETLYRVRHPERVKESQRKWRAAHPGWWRKYAGTTGRVAQQRAYHEKNRERRRIATRARYAANPEKFIQWSRRHQALVAGSMIGTVSYEEIVKRDRGICGICGEPVEPCDRSFDHIVPVSKGGPHSMANVQLAHLVCNKRKGAR